MHACICMYGVLYYIYIYVCVCVYMCAKKLVWCRYTYIYLFECAYVDTCMYVYKHLHTKTLHTENVDWLKNCFFVVVVKFL